MKRAEQYQDYISRLFPPSEEKKKKYNERLLPRTITFQVTDDCNLACTYCYQTNKNDNVLKLEDAKKFIDMLLSADDTSNEYINPEISPAIIIEFIGGEPFLEIELIDQITDYFISQMIELHHKWSTRYIISICSNGVLYFDDRVQEYIKKHLTHMSFSISIDGNKELHDACRIFPDGSGSYDIAIAGVKHFTEVLGGSMGSKMTIAPENVEHTYSALRNLIDLGYTEINLNCVYEEGWNATHAKILYSELKKCADYIIENEKQEIYISMFEDECFRPKLETDNTNWCGGNGDMIALDWKGDIYPCIRYMESSLGDEIEPIIIGNVSSGMMSNEKEKEAVKCLKCITRRSQSTDECFYCPIGEGCAWCSAYNYQVFGTADKRVTYICIMHKARALANAYYWNSLYRKYEEEKRFKIHIPDEWALEVIDVDELNYLKRLEEA